jgi:hypothetical protein
MIKLGPARSLLPALGAALLAACGAPSNLDLCHTGCDAARRCGLLSDADAINCHTSCDNRRGSFSDEDRQDDARCANAGAIRQQEHDCQNSACNQIAGCLLRIDRTCVMR